MLTASAPLAAQPPSETVVAVRVHGNHATPDATVLELAGIALGSPVSDAAIDSAALRLRNSGRFVSVEIRKRYASIADTSQVLIVVLVEEHPGASQDVPLPGPVGRWLSRTQWAPVLSYADGYGFTYGARFRTDLTGRGSRVSVPLTWGGTRQAGVELEWPLGHASGRRLAAAVAVSRVEHPFYRLGDTRRGGSVQVEQGLGPHVRLQAGGTANRVAFGAVDDTFATVRSGLTIDTRLNPDAPRDAVFAAVAVERLAFRGQGPANRVTTDARAYLGLGGPAVLAVRVAGSTSSQPLPPYEQALLGGMASMRGVRTGAAVGDNLVAGSAELRLPVTSPLLVGRFGLKAFLDTATTWNVGERLADRRFVVGVGGGVFMGVGPLALRLDVARSGGRTRLHVGLGLGF